MELIKKIDLDRLLDIDKTYVIGVSTGIDSMSLFHFLHSKGYKLVVAHINHNKRKESITEYEYLKEYCMNINVPFEGYTITEHITSNFQEVARNIRYRFYKEILDKYNAEAIITAHQADDLVETILMRLVRGSSLRGYSGIKEVSIENSYKVIRPLLYVKKDDIRLYQAQNNIKYFEDSSNFSDDYTRNIIRHNIITSFKDINPSYLNSILNFKEDLSLSFDYIDKNAKEFLSSNIIRSTNEIKIPLNNFNGLDEIIKRHTLLLLLNEISNNTVELTHNKMKELLNILSNKEGKEIEITKDYSVFKEYEYLVFVRKSISSKVYLEISDIKEYKIEGYGSIIVSKNYNELPSKKSYSICYNNLSDIFPIIVRNVEVGDRISINNITKKVYDVYKEYKVPKRLRDRQLVILNKDGIMFLPNLVRKETNTSLKNILYITYKEDNLC